MQCNMKPIKTTTSKITHGTNNIYSIKYHNLTDININK